MKTVIFNIEGMQCDGCVRTPVSFKDRQARVVFDSNVMNENRLASAIQGAGYQVPAGCP